MLNIATAVRKKRRIITYLHTKLKAEHKTHNEQCHHSSHSQWQANRQKTN